MGAQSVHEPVPLPSAVLARDEHEPDRRSQLRVVMVVANDVTRDSRVLREASALTDAGHRVTVIGIMTARTTAPAIEHTDGFTIWRLPYRARPTVWWVPPDFHARVRARTARQLARRRAAASATLRRGRRAAISAATRSKRRLARWVSGSRSLGRELLATPIRGWLAVIRRRGRRRAGWSVETLWNGSRPTPVAISPAALVGHAATALLAAAGTVQRWVGFAGLLLWGTAYVASDRVSGGGIAWLSGWRWRWMGWARYVLQRAPDADVWHGHDLTSLPAVVALKRARGGIAFYDSHELYVESGVHAGQPRWAKDWLIAIERRLVREVDAVLTVNESIRSLLEQTLLREDIRVVHNCPSLHALPSGVSPLRIAAGLSPATPLALYHGTFAPHRGIEQLLEAIVQPEVADVHLAFLGYGPMEGWLREQAALPPYEGRVHVLDGVAPSELHSWIAGADVAVVPIQPSTVNHLHSSPNKIFEAIAVGVPVAGSDFPEFRRVIADESNGTLGVLFDPTSPGEIARSIADVIAEQRRDSGALRGRCRQAAERRWNWPAESAGLLELYQAVCRTTEPMAATQGGRL